MWPSCSRGGRCVSQRWPILYKRAWQCGVLADHGGTRCRSSRISPAYRWSHRTFFDLNYSSKLGRGSVDMKNRKKRLEMISGGMFFFSILSRRMPTLSMSIIATHSASNELV